MENLKDTRFKSETIAAQERKRVKRRMKEQKRKKVKREKKNENQASSQVDFAKLTGKRLLVSSKLETLDGNCVLSSLGILSCSHDSSSKHWNKSSKWMLLMTQNKLAEAHEENDQG